MPDVGFLYSGSPNSMSALLTNFKNLMPGGVNVVPRNADDDYSTLLGHAGSLINNVRVQVLVAAGGPVSAIAARDATATQPLPKTRVVFTSVTDPVGSQLYTAGGNLTGVAGMTTELDAARLRILQELDPTRTTIGVLTNPNRPNVAKQLADLMAGKDPKLTLVPQPAGTQGSPGTGPKVRQAIQNLPTTVRALLVTADPLFNSRRPDVIPEVAAKRIPAIYQWSEFVHEGGLMSFGPSIDEEYSAAANYVIKLLNNPGLPAADIPLYQPTKFKLVIRFGTATTLGINIPQSLLVRAELIP
jgi:putative tryptophan/tyrosine transport system substrate-binding protein